MGIIVVSMEIIKNKIFIEAKYFSRSFLLLYNSFAKNNLQLGYFYLITYVIKTYDIFLDICFCCCCVVFI